jgi:hypothetical protein
MKLLQRISTLLRTRITPLVDPEMGFWWSGPKTPPSLHCFWGQNNVKIIQFESESSRQR